jgi:hypothetical protein
MKIGKKALIQMVVALLLLGVLLLWQIDFVRNVYFTDKLTPLGLILNGTIIIVFLSGIYKLIIGFLHYSFEENQIETFLEGKESGDENILERLSTKSIIAHRYFKIKKLYERKIPINHGVMSSIMLAEESLYQSFPRFVNNVLILLGVFGTIISLILALAGASTVLKTSAAGQGMWLIIHGMNTALTTTATAIVCFFFFTYFYHKLTDVQTYVFGKVEESVLTYIVPEFTFDIETINYRTERLISTLEETIKEITKSSDFIKNTLEGVNAYNSFQLQKANALVSSQDAQLKKTDLLITKLEKIAEVLKEGFRLDRDNA